MKSCNIAIILFIATLFLQACNVINPAEPVPAYIKINPFTLNITDSVTQGSSAHQIKDGWVFVDNDLLGVFELPATVPILGEGNHSILISPGIWYNGISSEHETYDLYVSYDTSISLEENKTFTINPITSYRSNVIFEFIEDFDGAGTSLESISGANIIKTTAADEVFEGKNSGKISLNESNNFVEITSIDKLSLPRGNADVFIEINYKTEANIYFGLMSSITGQKQYDLVLTPKDTWNKVYIQLADYIGILGTGEVTLLIQTSLPSDKTAASVYLDNIKVVYK